MTVRSDLLQLMQVAQRTKELAQKLYDQIGFDNHESVSVTRVETPGDENLTADDRTKHPHMRPQRAVRKFAGKRTKERGSTKKLSTQELETFNLLSQSRAFRSAAEIGRHIGVPANNVYGVIKRVRGKGFKIRTADQIRDSGEKVAPGISGFRLN